MSNTYQTARQEKHTSEKEEGPVKKLLHFIFLSLALLSMGLTSLSTQSRAGPFTIMVPHMDISADTASKAKQEALLKAQELAFKKLLQQLIHGKEKEDVEEKLASLHIPDYVSSIQILNERYSGTRYFADIQVTFEQGALLKQLAQHHIPYNPPSSQALIIPIFQESGHVSIWDRNNPWVQAWNKNELETRLEIRYLLGDLQDQKSIKPSEITLPQASTLFPYILTRYGVEQAFTVQAYKIRSFSGAPILEITIIQHTPYEPAIEVLEVRSATEAEDDQALYQLAVEKSLKQIEQMLATKIVKDEPSNQQLMRFHFTHFDDWIRTKDMIEALPFTIKTQVLAQTAHGLLISLDIKEKHSVTFLKTLQQKGYTVFEDRNGILDVIFHAL